MQLDCAYNMVPVKGANHWVYPPEYYAESEFASGLLKISDFPTELEQVLAGIRADDAGTEQSDI